MRRLFLMVSRLLAIAAVPLMISLVGSHVSAVDVFPGCADNKSAVSKTDICTNVNNASTENPIIGAIKLTITILSIIVGIAAVIMIIIAGLSFITANGDPQAIAKARGSIIYALVGIVIVALAQTLVAFVLNRL